MDIEAEFASMAKLERGWNSYGAEPIDPRTIDEARRAVQEFAAWGTPDEIAPMPDGAVLVSWTHEGRLIDVTIVPALPRWITLQINGSMIDDG